METLGLSLKIPHRAKPHLEFDALVNLETKCGEITGHLKKQLLLAKPCFFR